jgi:hypothetical protein
VTGPGRAAHGARRRAGAAPAERRRLPRRQPLRHRHQPGAALRRASRGGSRAPASPPT